MTTDKMREALEARLKAFQRDERGTNNVEVVYWRQQYKQLATDAIAALASAPSPQAQAARNVAAPRDSDAFIKKTNEEFVAWCRVTYNPDALDERGMISLHGLWAWQEQERRRAAALTGAVVPIDMVLHCPACGLQHIDKDNSEDIRIEAAERGFVHGSRDWEDWIEEREWTNPPHRSHICAGCGYIWRPADVPTNGVQAVQTKGKNDSPKEVE